MISLSEIINEMTKEAGLDSSFAESFKEKLASDSDLCQEFVDYIKTRQFSCINKVSGYTVVDILIWQLDHFRAEMDRGKYGMRENECLMLLKAFDTLFDMKKDPEKFKRMLTEETGTDMPAEYF